MRTGKKESKTLEKMRYFFYKYRKANQVRHIYSFVYSFYILYRFI